MKRVVNKEELRVYWQLEKWYEKASCVVGVLFSLLVMFSFIVGFVQEL